MAIFLLIISQALALILIASLLFTLPRPLNMPVYLDDGASVAGLISEHGGDLEVAITDITAIMTAGIEAMARNGQMDENAASFALATMPTIVRLGVNSSLSGMLARFDTPESTPAP